MPFAWTLGKSPFIERARFRNDCSFRRSLTSHRIRSRTSRGCPYEWVRFVRAVIRKTSLLQDRTDNRTLCRSRLTTTHHRRETRRPLADELSGECAKSLFHRPSVELAFKPNWLPCDRPGRSPLHDVRQHALAARRADGCETFVSLRTS